MVAELRARERWVLIDGTLAILASAAGDSAAADRRGGEHVQALEDAAPRSTTVDAVDEHRGDGLVDSPAGLTDDLPAVRPSGTAGIARRRAGCDLTPSRP